jgi:hypothetical protein
MNGDVSRGQIHANGSSHPLLNQFEGDGAHAGSNVQQEALNRARFAEPFQKQAGPRPRALVAVLPKV